MDGQGEVLHFGGQVMKNVAGYDVSRLLAGSLGTLGLILEVSVKVLPQPPAEATLQVRHGRHRRRCASSTNGAASRCRSPPALASTACSRVRLAGAEAAVKAARAVAGRRGRRCGRGRRFWAGLREQTDAFFAAIAPKARAVAALAAVDAAAAAICPARN